MATNLSDNSVNYFVPSLSMLAINAEDKLAEVFYNRDRRHWSLGYVAPAKFEGNEYS